MTVQEKPYPIVGLVIDTFGEWLKHRRELREMREMDAANFGRIRLAAAARQRSTFSHKGRRQKRRRAKISVPHRRDGVRDRDRPLRHIGVQPLHHTPIELDGAA